VVEFVLVAVLVVALVVALLQVAFALYIRNTLISAAGEGARFAAAANQTPEGGAQHTRTLIRESLPDEYASDVTAGYRTGEGVPTIEVTVRAQLPVFGWLGPSDVLSVSGHAMEES
jgi:Flp pilus assembly protein TadG